MPPPAQKPSKLSDGSACRLLQPFNDFRDTSSYDMLAQYSEPQLGQNNRPLSKIVRECEKKDQSTETPGRHLEIQRLNEELAYKSASFRSRLVTLT
ncbi:hypothetical protein N7540_013040 [Penicillium herquei]|nr:hypothetical protein N7540_013040 [Penicillium herquei]